MCPSVSGTYVSELVIKFINEVCTCALALLVHLHACTCNYLRWGLGLRRVFLISLANQELPKRTVSPQWYPDLPKKLSSSKCAFFSEVVMLLKIILVNPANNAVSKHLFSAMHRLKMYLRSTMGQSRLNAVMLLHVQKEMTDQLSLIESANMFASTEHRMAVFSTFSKNDL